MVEIPADIFGYIETVANASPDTTAIWLMGSRANDKANADSDWDFLVFSSENGLVAIQYSLSLMDNVDVLVVVDGTEFQNPWKNKSGNLRSWNWNQQNDNQATYKGTKWPDGAEMWEESTCKAFRVWPRN